MGRAALARVSVVVMRPCWSRFVTRLRKTARRWSGCLPRFDPELRCRMVNPLVESRKFKVETQCHWPDGHRLPSRAPEGQQSGAKAPPLENSRESKLARERTKGR